MIENVAPEYVLGAFSLLGIAGSGGVTWGVMKTVGKNTRESVAKLEVDFGQHKAEDTAFQLEAVQRLSRIEERTERLHAIEDKLDRALQQPSVG